jgi:hypothetical protein
MYPRASPSTLKGDLQLTVNRATHRDLPTRLAPLALGLLGALLLGYTVGSPAGRMTSVAVYGALALAVALTIPPHLFLPLTLLLVGVSTGFGSAIFSVGPAIFYVSDLVVLVVVARAALPRARHQGIHALRGAPQVLFIAWLAIMAFAAVRAKLEGVPTVAILRQDLALFYWPLLYFGFTRVLAERSLDKRLLWRNLLLVALGLAFYMFIARALNHPFQDQGLANVPTGAGETVQRNFGFASAFTIYPTLVIAAIAAFASARDHRVRWLLIGCIGVIATLMTLVRGEIFSLALGIVLVVWLSPARRPEQGRVRAAVQLGAVLAVALLAVLAVDPKLGHAVIQRAVPFTHQAEGATTNADYRFQAMGAGIDVARSHPLGLGVVDEQRLADHGVQFGYLVHSGLATLLVYGGWAALVVGALAILAAIRRSFATAAAVTWRHSAFVGAIVMLGFYSLGAAGLAGDTWVVPLGALVVALRFGLEP